MIIHALESALRLRSSTRRWLTLALLVFWMSACGATPVAPQQAIVGNWANAQGGVIKFYANHTGFVPGIAGSIADTTFTYTVPDSTHMQLSMSGQPTISMEIKIEGDTMTWHAPRNDTAFVYKRIK